LNQTAVLSSTPHPPKGKKNLATEGGALWKAGHARKVGHARKQQNPRAAEKVSHKQGSVPSR